MRELLWTVQKLVNSHRDHLPKEVAYVRVVCARNASIGAEYSLGGVLTLCMSRI